MEEGPELSQLVPLIWHLSVYSCGFFPLFSFKTVLAAFSFHRLLIFTNKLNVSIGLK